MLFITGSCLLLVGNYGDIKEELYIALYIPILFLVIILIKNNYLNK